MVGANKGGVQWTIVVTNSFTTKHKYLPNTVPPFLEGTDCLTNKWTGHIIWGLN